MRVLAVIPARGGSKGIRRKNVRLLCGKPLLQYTAEAALAATRLSRVILTTDDEEIAKVARRCGLEVPFIRPQELALDETPMLPVVQHALREMESDGEGFDAVCLLQPTSPLRTPETIDGCIELLEEKAADSVATVLPVPDVYNPCWVYFQDHEGTLSLSTGHSTPITRRQELRAAFHREGSVYVTRRNVLIEGNSLYGERLIGYRVNGSLSVNLDEEDDWRRAEHLIPLVQTSARIRRPAALDQ